MIKLLKDKMSSKNIINISKNRDMYKCIIETPKNSKNIYKYIAPKDELYLSKVLLSPLTVPFNIAILPNTKWYNNENLKTIILSDDVIPPRTIASIVPLALLRLRKNNIDHSIIISKLENDENLKNVFDLSNINKIYLKEIQLFYNNLNKYSIDGFVDNEHAINALNYAFRKYKL